jgi:putative ABC transport system substrate-binding protein
VRRIHRIVLALPAALVLALSISGCGAHQEARPEASAAAVKVGIEQFNDIPAFTAIVASFKQAMAAAGYIEGENVTYELHSAHGDVATADGLAMGFANEPFDLLLGVGTPAAQALAGTHTVIPIVFVGVTDPVGAGLVQNVAAPEAGITGVANPLPVEKHLALARQLVPEARRVGLLYNPAEAQSDILAKDTQAAAAALNLTVVEATIGAAQQAAAAAEQLAARTDAVLVLTDTTALAAIDDVAAACRAAGVPLIAGDLTAIETAAVAGYAFDPDALGRAAGEMAASVLASTPAAGLPVLYSDDVLLAVNAGAAAATGIKLPAALTAAADRSY